MAQTERGLPGNPEGLVSDNQEAVGGLSHQGLIHPYPSTY